MAGTDLTHYGRDEIGRPKGFDDYEVRLGDLLRGERATLGKSLMDVQRELRINATYIAAIENCDYGAFETPSFVSGFVRSYARYLKLDQEQVYRQFCEESGFVPSHGLADEASTLRNGRAVPVAGPMTSDMDDAIFSKSPSAIVPNKKAWTDQFEAAAVGSIAVLCLLVAGLGYGAWSVFQEIQKVQVVPSENTPVVQSEFNSTDVESAGTTDVVGVSLDQRADKLERMYRPPALDTPILVARDAPISTLDPNRFANFPEPKTDQTVPTFAGLDAIIADVVEEVSREDIASTAPQVVEDLPPTIAIVATREAWVQVTSSTGSVILAKIMQPGEEFTLPQTEGSPTMRAGMSGSVYFSVNRELYGPAGAGSNVVKNVELSVASLSEAYAPAIIDNDGELRTLIAQANFESFDAPLEQ